MELLADVGHGPDLLPNLIPRLQIIFGDDDESVLSATTEDLYAPVASEEYTRVLAARVPGRATQYRIGLLAYAVAAGATGIVHVDDVELNGNTLIVSDIAMGQLIVRVEVCGRWL